MTSEPSPRLRALASVCGAVVGALPFGTLLLGLGWHPARTAVAQGFGSNFFDLQARALLAGHLWVPSGSLGIEGFVEHGKTYMYFPPFPSLIRLPVLLTTDQFDGRLTVASMAAGWVVFATMSCRLVWAVREILRPNVPLSRAEAFATGILIAAVTGGTVLTFDASLPWVYHEVYLWSAALITGGLYWLLRYLRTPSRTALGWLVTCSIAAILTRFPGGLALGLTCILAAVLVLTRRMPLGTRGDGWRLALAGLLPLIISAALNWAKFRHPFLFPLTDQVWTQVNAHRREALAVNGGTITGPQFLPTTLLAYLRPDGVRFVDYFPWITLPGQPPAGVAGAFLDQTYRTGSVTAFSPLLSVLTLLSAGVLVGRTGRVRKTELRLILGCGLLTVVPVLAYGYVTNRYTSDFVPLLTVGGAVGFFTVVQAMAPRGRWLVASVATFAVAALTLYSLAAQFLTGYAALAMTSRGSSLDAYVSHQISTGGGANGALVHLVIRSSGLPGAGKPDELFVRGDCDALYVNTGDHYEPWITVEQKPEVVTVTPRATIGTGRVVLFTITGTSARQVVLETKADHTARLVIADTLAQVPGPDFPLYPDTPVRIGVGIRSDTGMATVSSSPGGDVADVPWAFWDSDWVARPGQITVSANAGSEAGAIGLSFARSTGTDAPLCRRLLASVG